jgi:hypothetical protein
MPAEGEGLQQSGELLATASSSSSSSSSEVNPLMSEPGTFKASSRGPVSQDEAQTARSRGGRRRLHQKQASMVSKGMKHPPGDTWANPRNKSN